MQKSPVPTNNSESQQSPTAVPHIVSLGLVLGTLWALLSGYYTPLLLGLGALSVALVVFIAVRMEVVDHEGHPVHLGARVFGYWAWLIKEIVIANIDVARRILSPTLKISPRIIRVRSSQTTDLGHTIFANAITLTPGTVSMSVEDGEIVVHALTAESAAALESGEMNRRTSEIEGIR